MLLSLGTPLLGLEVCKHTAGHLEIGYAVSRQVVEWLHSSFCAVAGLGQALA